MNPDTGSFHLPPGAEQPTYLATIIASVAGALVSFREHAGPLFERAFISALTAILAACMVNIARLGWEKFKKFAGQKRK